MIKSKITKILNLEENQFGKSIITWQNQMRSLKQFELFEILRISIQGIYCLSYNLQNISVFLLNALQIVLYVSLFFFIGA